MNPKRKNQQNIFFNVSHPDVFIYTYNVLHIIQKHNISFYVIKLLCFSLIHYTLYIDKKLHYSHGMENMTEHLIK